jgi:SAM-dependent methyltransferase
MKRSLLELLRSPRDGSALRLVGEQEVEGEVVAGTLVGADDERYAIVDGVPEFAPELADDPTFSFKWRRIGDSYGHEEPSRSIRRRWYLDRFGFADESALHAALRRAEQVLDAGAGSGVDTSLFAESGALVVAVDLSRDATAATYKRLGARQNVHVLQGDINRLPFAPGTFGYVSSDQVLHHTPDTSRAFAAVSSLVRAGGTFVSYVYNHKAPLREYADDYIRARATVMSNEECWELSRRLALLGRELTRLHASLDVPEEIELLGFRAGEHDVQRFIYWNVLKCFWNEEFDLDLNIAVNFDWYHPRYAHRHTRAEVESWIASAGLEVARLVEVESGIAAVAVRR